MQSTQILPCYLFLAALTCFTKDCSAQSDGNALRDSRDYTAAVGANNDLDIRLRTTGDVSAQLLDLNAQIVTEVSLGITQLGGVVSITNYDGKYQYIVGGRRTTPSDEGRIIMIEVDAAASPQTIVVMGYAAHADFDPYVLAYNHSTFSLFALDAKNRRVMYLDVSPGGNSILAAENLWVELANSQQIPALQKPESIHCVGLGTGNAAGEAMIACSLDDRPRYKLTWNGQQTAVALLSHEVAGPYILNRAHLRSSEAIAFKLPNSQPSQTWIMEDPDGNSIAQGNFAGGDEVSVQLSSHLKARPGEMHFLKVSGSDKGSSFYPHVCYGERISAPGFALSDVLTTPVSQAPGWMIPSVGVETSLTGVVTGGMAFTFRDENGIDPLVPFGGKQILDTQWVSDFSFEASKVRGTVGHKLVVPESLPEGTIILAQYWFILPDSSIAISDIIGLRVELESSALVKSSSNVQTKEEAITTNNTVISAKARGRFLRRMRSGLKSKKGR